MEVILAKLIIGTAGHVDHGKTELTRALTGVETDRLKEEKDRGISILLGFAPLEINADISAGIIDVPGHEKFIKTMLAGVYGIDLVLFVISAEEGIMPQTREHLEIISLLGVEKGIIVLTKTDLVDEEWLLLMQEEIEEFFINSSLKGAPIVAVSAKTGAGIDELRQVIAGVAMTITPKDSYGVARMPIDRAFSVSGFGTIVTGTLWSGSLVLGQYLDVVPTGVEGRIRSIQVHGKKVERAVAGERVALNLAGISLDEVPHGTFIAETGLLMPTDRLDVEVNLLSNIESLAHNTRLRFYHGTGEYLGRINFFDRTSLGKNEKCFAQIVLEKPLSPLNGDTLILRTYSPLFTIGSAKIIEKNANKHRRKKAELLAELEQKSKGGSGDFVLSFLDNSSDIACSITEIEKGTQIFIDEIEGVLAGFLADGEVFEVDKLYFSKNRLNRFKKEVLANLADFHKAYPLRRGIGKGELKSKTYQNGKQKKFNLLLDALIAGGEIVDIRGNIARSDFEIKPTIELENWGAGVVRALDKAEFSPPRFSELIVNIAGIEEKEALIWLFEKYELVKIADDIVLTKGQVDKGISLAVSQIEGFGGLSLGEMRDLMSTSRKFALAFLEYLDGEKVLVKVGDERLLAGRQT